MKKKVYAAAIVLCSALLLSPEALAQSADTESISLGSRLWNAFSAFAFNFVLLGIDLHMIYVIFFKKTQIFPEEFDASGDTTKNNEYVYDACHDLYFNQFLTIKDESGGNGNEQSVSLPVGKSGRKQAHAILSEIIKNHLPVDGEANDILKDVCSLYNHSGKFKFIGEKGSIILFAILAIIVSFISGLSSAFYLGLSVIGYWLVSYLPGYIFAEREVREKEGKKNGWDIIGHIIGFLFQLAGKIVAVTGAGWIGFIFNFIMFFFIVNFLSLIVIFQYLRVFIFEK